MGAWLIETCSLPEGALEQYPLVDIAIERMGEVAMIECLRADKKSARSDVRFSTIHSFAVAATRSRGDRSAMTNDMNDEVILAARLFLATLFLIFGWRKLMDYSDTVNQMVQDGLPTPVLATAVAIFMELPVAFAVAVGHAQMRH